MDQWFCIVNGQQHGPVPLEVLRQWARESRVLPDDYVWCGGMAQWMPAGAVSGLFSHGTYSAVVAAGACVPAADVAPHRGTLVLVLGLLGLVPLCLFICGIVAWVLGSRDLREMDAGRMDPGGRGMTQAARIVQSTPLSRLSDGITYVTLTPSGSNFQLLLRLGRFHHFMLEKRPK